MNNGNEAAEINKEITANVLLSIVEDPTEKQRLQLLFSESGLDIPQPDNIFIRTAEKIIRDKESDTSPLELLAGEEIDPEILKETFNALNKLSPDISPLMTDLILKLGPENPPDRIEEWLNEINEPTQDPEERQKREALKNFLTQVIQKVFQEDPTLAELWKILDRDDIQENIAQNFVKVALKQPQIRARLIQEINQFLTPETLEDIPSSEEIEAREKLIQEYQTRLRQVEETIPKLMEQLDLYLKSLGYMNKRGVYGSGYIKDRIIRLEGERSKLLYRLGLHKKQKGKTSQMPYYSDLDAKRLGEIEKELEFLTKSPSEMAKIVEDLEQQIERLQQKREQLRQELATIKRSLYTPKSRANEIQRTLIEIFEESFKEFLDTIVEENIEESAEKLIDIAERFRKILPAIFFTQEETPDFAFPRNLTLSEESFRIITRSKNLEEAFSIFLEKYGRKLKTIISQQSDENREALKIITGLEELQALRTVDPKTFRKIARAWLYSVVHAKHHAKKPFPLLRVFKKFTRPTSPEQLNEVLRRYGE